MKLRHTFLFLLFPLGLALIFLSGTIGERLDRSFNRDKLAFSRATRFLEQGNRPEYENTLKDFILNQKSSPPLRALAFYNLGNVSLEKAMGGDPAAAKDALFYFREALRNDPHLFPAKNNLELLLRMEKNREKKEKSESSQQETEGKKQDTTKKGPVTKPPVLGSNP